MIVVLFGAPGSGKGTQAQLLVRDDGFTHISTGDLLRAEIDSGSPEGLKIKQIVDQGDLVPDELVFSLLETTLRRLGNKRVILDGIPRNLKQALDLDTLLAVQDRKVDIVVDLNAAPSELISRMTGRYSCKTCGAVYHEITRRPFIDGVCDHCGGKNFSKRSDDNMETAVSRLKVYDQETSPVREYYASQGKLKPVDASQGVDVIRGQIQLYVNEQKNIV